MCDLLLFFWKYIENREKLANTMKRKNLDTEEVRKKKELHSNQNHMMIKKAGILIDSDLG